MRLELLALILAMAAVTYLPRALPAVVLDKLRPGPKVEKFLNMIPYTAMASLIFPGIFLVDSQRWYIGTIGGLAAFVLAWKRLPVAVTVLASVGVVFVLYLLH